MQNATEIAAAQDRSAGAQQAVATRIQKALAEILRSSPFHASKQSQQLLQYIVDQSLAGHAECLKERIIGAQVFGRPADYDTNDDPVVRARVAEVRKRLAQYYVGEGNLSSIRIEISPGSYLASFSDSSKFQPKEPETHEIEPAPRESPTVASQLPPFNVVHQPTTAAALNPRSRPWRLLGLAALGLLAAGLAYTFRPKSAVEQFWSPILETSKPVLLYTGAFPVYLPSDELIERYKATHQLSDLNTKGYEFLIPLSKDQRFGPGDLIESQNDFVTLGDISANVRVTSLLTRFHHGFDLRSGEDVAFGDLRQSPAILIGAFNNQLTLQMTGDLPFVFASGLTIQDRSNVQHQWHPAYSSPGKVEMDYALVARLADSKTGGPLVTIGGITQYGTRAAGEFICSEQEVRELVKSSPQGWASKNLELLLQTRVVNDIPTNPTVVEIRYW